MHPQSLWHPAEPDRFRFRFWPDDVAASVFDLRSGETHWLSPLGLELLHLLDSRAQTSPALAAALVEEFGDLSAAREAIDDELPRLRRIGLVAESA